MTAAATIAWCSTCADATDHVAPEHDPFRLVCTDCGSIRTDRKAQRAAGRGFTGSATALDGIVKRLDKGENAT